MNVKALRSWLLSRPRGTRLVLKTGNQVQEVGIESDQNWSRLADSIETIGPDLIEVYAADGKLIRATKCDIFDDEDEGEQEAAAVAKLKAASDAETARFAAFADHIAQAYRFATEIAFERMVDLFAAVNRRSEALEKSLDATHRLLGKAYQEQVDNAIEQAENADPLSNLVGAFVQGSTQAQVENAQQQARGKPNGKPNGKSNGKAEA
jgi:hypothetical protein